MSDDHNDGRPTRPRPRRLAPTLDLAEQGERSLAFMDQLYDAAQDDAMEADGPVSRAAHRLATTAREMVD